jgi:hypothetical protein
VATAGVESVVPSESFNRCPPFPRPPLRRMGEGLVPLPRSRTHRKRGGAGNLAVTGTCQDSDLDPRWPCDLELDVGLDVGGSQTGDLELPRPTSGAVRMNLRRELGGRSHLANI